MEVLERQPIPLLFMLYNKAFTLYDMGGASAVATIMLVISLILTAIQLKMYDKGKE